MNLGHVASTLMMLAWASGNGVLVFAMIGAFGLDYNIGTRIMAALLILFLFSAGNLFALHFIYDRQI